MQVHHRQAGPVRVRRPRASGRGPLPRVPGQAGGQSSPTDRAEEAGWALPVSRLRGLGSQRPVGGAYRAQHQASLWEDHTAWQPQPSDDEGRQTGFLNSRAHLGGEAATLEKESRPDGACRPQADPDMTGLMSDGAGQGGGHWPPKLLSSSEPGQRPRDTLSDVWSGEALLQPHFSLF